jgi:hypothetical protein
VAGHWQLIFSGHPWALAWTRTMPAAPGLALLVGMSLGVLGFGAGWILNHAPGRPASWLAGWLALAIAVSFCLASPAMTLEAYRDDPAHCPGGAALRNAVDYLNMRVTARDLVVVQGYLDPIWYCYFNFGRPGSPWVGLAAGAPSRERSPNATVSSPSPATVALLELAAARYDRLWWVADLSVPPGARLASIEGWLDQFHDMREQRDFDNLLSTQLWILSPG